MHKYAVIPSDAQTVVASNLHDHLNSCALDYKYVVQYFKLFTFLLSII